MGLWVIDRVANQKLFRFLLEKCHPPILKIKEKQFGLRRRVSGGRSRGAGNQTIRSNRVRASFKVFDHEQLGDFWARIFQDFSQFQTIFRSSRRRFGVAGTTHKKKFLSSDFSGAAKAALSGQFLIRALQTRSINNED